MTNRKDAKALFQLTTSLLSIMLWGCSADEAIEAGTDCEQKCPVGAQLEFAKSASGSCGADGMFTATGDTQASGTCHGSGDCQVACIYPACGESQTMVITATGFRCEASAAPCDDVDCDGRGSCRVVSDAPECDCDPGYVANGIHCDPDAAPHITAVTPLTGVLGSKTVFTITGENLPVTLVAEVEKCNDIHFTVREASEQEFFCTPVAIGIAARRFYPREGGAKLFEDEIMFVCPDCTIKAACFAQGEPHPDTPCLVCDSERSKTDWSDDDGNLCDDGSNCNGTDWCKGGICSIHESCDELECGDDGCGGNCGSCGCGEECTGGQCDFTACDDKMCGEDGCGGSCASQCTADQYCESHQCVAKPVTCGDGACSAEEDEDKCNCPGDCGDPCEGKTCGPDLCGDICGDCPAGESCQENGQCSVVCGDAQCGVGEDKCNCLEDCQGGCEGCCNGDVCVGGILSSACGKNGDTCSSCTDGKTCQNHVCEYMCGDGACAPLANETCVTCTEDCGDCCGNGVCDNGEATPTCPADCPAVTPGFVTISAGTFWMGSPSGCPGPTGYPGSCLGEAGWSDLDPLHYVTLTHSFEIQAKEVTQGEWKSANSGWNPSRFPLCGDSCPVEQVNWYEAAAYANTKSWAAGKTPCYAFAAVVCRQAGNPPDGTDYGFCMNATHGGINSATVTLKAAATPYDCAGYRLPTESEWEYAARAGSSTAIYPSFGNHGTLEQMDCLPLDPNLEKIAWYCGNSIAAYADASECSCFGCFEPSVTCGTQTTGGKATNLWGLWDMAGNVYEMCWDWSGAYPTGTPVAPDIDPAGPATGSARVVRGGAWTHAASNCRSADRSSVSPDDRYKAGGLRLSRTIGP